LCRKARPGFSSSNGRLRRGRHVCGSLQWAANIQRGCKAGRDAREEALPRLADRRRTAVTQMFPVPACQMPVNSSLRRNRMKKFLAWYRMDMKEMQKMME